MVRILSPVDDPDDLTGAIVDVTHAAATTEQQIAVGDAINETAGDWSLVGTEFFSGGDLRVESSPVCVSAFIKGRPTSGVAWLTYTLDAPIANTNVVYVDVTLQWLEHAGGHPFENFRVRVWDGANATGNSADRALTAAEYAAEATAVKAVPHTIRVAVPRSSLSQVASVSFGIVGDPALAGGSSRVRWGMWDVKVADATVYDDAIVNSAAGETLFVPADYATANTQTGVPSEVYTGRGLVDLHPSTAVIGRHHGRYLVREARLDETGATDVTSDLLRYLSEVPDHSLVEFPAGATFRVDGYLHIFDRRRLTFLADGVLFHQAVESLESLWQFDGCDGIIWRGGRFFGHPKEWDWTGDELTTVAGSPVVNGTTVELSVIADEVEVPKKSGTAGNDYAWVSRDYLGNVTLSATLSDSAQVANDVTLTIETAAGVVLEQSTITVTATPTVYALTHRLVDIDDRLRMKVKKATATSNTVTVHSMRQPGRIRYDAGRAFNHAFDVVGGSVDVDIADVWVEGFAGDALKSSDLNYNCRIARFTSRGCNRQGVSWNQGVDTTIEQFVIRESGRSGIDLEPQGDPWQVVRMKIRDGVIRHSGINGFTCKNWWRTINLRIDDLTIENSGAFAFEGGSVGGTLNFVSTYDTPDDAVEGPDVVFRGRGMRVDVTAAYGVELENHVGGTLTSGNNRLNVTVATPRQGVPVLNNEQAGTQLGRLDVVDAEVAFDENHFGTRIAELGPLNSGGLVTVGHAITAAPNTYKATAAVGLWFPRGLDMRDEPLHSPRAFGASSGTNLTGSAAVAGTSSTVAVTFPTFAARYGWTFPQPDSIGTWSPVDHADGALAVGGYDYAVGSCPPGLGPLTPTLTTTNAVLSGANDAFVFDVRGLYDSAAQAIINDLVIYRRATGGGAYTTRYLLRAATGFGGQKQNTGVAQDRIHLVDLGSSLIAEHPKSVDGWGLPATAAAGSWNPPVDESGWEPDTSYTVFVETDWNAGGWWVTSKAVSGFTINFSTAAPGGGGTARWFIVRS